VGVGERGWGKRKGEKLIKVVREIEGEKGEKGKGKKLIRIKSIKIEYFLDIFLCT